jgi:anti-sigma-K factor RskA
MSKDHKLSVRDYLLGTLPDRETRAFEEEYIGNRCVLREVQAAEAELIADYLAGRLMPDSRELFERRCLQLPALRQRVEDARKYSTPPQPGGSPFWPRWALAVAAILIVAGAAALLYRQRPAQLSKVQAPLAKHVDRLVVAFSVNPGVSMGSGAFAAQVALPANSVLDLTLKLPAQASAVSLPVNISRIGADGRLRRVWAAPSPVESKAAESGRVLSVQLDSNLLPPGDYAAYAGTPDDRTRETFVFRVVEAQ